MSFPFVIDNLSRRLADALSELLEQSVDRPLDIATAYFSISGYRIVKDGLHKLGAFRLLLGTDPQSGADLGLKVQGGSSPGRRREDLNAPQQGFQPLVAESASGRLLLDSCVWGYRHGPEGSGWTNKLIGHHS